MKNSRCLWPAGAASLLCGIVMLPAVWGGGVYLVEGRGLEGVLEVGRAAPKTARPAGNSWYRAAELEFQTDSPNARGKVVLIRCRDTPCLTDRGVRIGSTVAEVLRHYGAPQERKDSARAALLRYRGIGFMLQQGVVTAIYILPP